MNGNKVVLRTYGLKLNALVIHERPTETVTEFWKYSAGAWTWTDDSEIEHIDYETGIVRVHHHYSPPGYYAYVHYNDLIKQSHK
jgi:hypothetical protein